MFEDGDFGRSLEAFGQRATGGWGLGDLESSKNAGGHFVKSTQGRVPWQDPGCHNLSDCERAEREAGVTRVTD